MQNHSHSMFKIILKTFSVAKMHLTALITMTGVMSFFMPLRNFILLSIFLVIADVITGVIAAKKRGEKIRSRGIYRTAEKLLVYLLAIIAAAGFHHIFVAPAQISWFEQMNLVHIVAGSICMTEFLSMRENIETITNTDILGGAKKVLDRFIEATPKKEQKKEVE